MVFAAVFTGFRVSELAALKWGDVDSINNKITIDERYCRGDWGEPKSDASNATMRAGNNQEAHAPRSAIPHSAGASRRWEFSVLRETCRASGNLPLPTTIMAGRQKLPAVKPRLYRARA
jgi:hypothetical protein